VKDWGQAAFESCGDVGILNYRLYTQVTCDHTDCQYKGAWTWTEEVENPELDLDWWAEFRNHQNEDDGRWYSVRSVSIQLRLDGVWTTVFSYKPPDTDVAQDQTASGHIHGA